MTHVVEKLAFGNVVDSNGDVRSGADYRNLDYGFIELPDAEDDVPSVQKEVTIHERSDDDDNEREDAYSDLGGGVPREPLTSSQEDAIYRMGLGNREFRERVGVRQAPSGLHGAELARQAIAAARQPRH